MITLVLKNIQGLKMRRILYLNILFYLMLTVLAAEEQEPSMDMVVKLLLEHNPQIVMPAML
jgi:hypothetical protein